VNNSGIAVRAQPQDLTAAQWDSVLDVNLRAAFLAAKEAYPHMAKAAELVASGQVRQAARSALDF